MQEGPSVRVLLFHPERPVSRAAIDWIADRQRYARVIVPPSLERLEALPARARHEPFAAPGPDAARLAAEAAPLIAAPGPFSGIVTEAAILALLEEGAVMVFDRAIFRDLVALSSWSMNVPERPTDGLLAQHLGIASRLPLAWSDAAIEAVEALLAFDSDRVEKLARERRRRIALERRAPPGLRPLVLAIRNSQWRHWRAPSCSVVWAAWWSREERPRAFACRL